MDPALSTNARPEIIPLWPDGAPGSEDWDQEEQESVLPPSLKVIRNVARPTLTAYPAPPSAAAGTAVIVCPGGAFHFLCIDMEGTDVARWLNARGVAAFVLSTGSSAPGRISPRRCGRPSLTATGWRG